MALRIIVTAKQVVDPEAPASAFKVDSAAKQMLTANVPNVVNGFDENAVEAALRIKEAAGDATITVISAGQSFAMEVIKKPLAMGADNLVLLQDPAFANSIDPTIVTHALAAAIRKLGGADLILCGRQASDWDNTQVPLGLAELLSLPIVTIARKVQVLGQQVRVERVLPDGYEVVEAPLPCIVTVSNELGQPRVPNVRGVMMANRKSPTVWSAAELGLDLRAIGGALELVGLSAPEQRASVQMITGENDSDAGRKLAMALRAAKLI